MDLWWSGTHHRGGNVQVVTAPDGWPRWVFDVQPSREHDVTCARTHPSLLDALQDWTDAEHAVLAEGEADRLTCPIKKPTKPTTTATAHTLKLTTEQRTSNLLHSATRALAERGNSLLKTTLKALQQVSLCPWRISPITAAALVLLHTEHNRTTRSTRYWERLTVPRSDGGGVVRRKARLAADHPSKITRWWVARNRPRRRAKHAHVVVTFVSTRYAYDQARWILASSTSLTPEQRAERSRQAARARWERANAEQRRAGTQAARQARFRPETLLRHARQLPVEEQTDLIAALQRSVGLVDKNRP